MNLKTYYKTSVCLFVLFTFLCGQIENLPDNRLQNPEFQYIDNGQIYKTDKHSIKVQIWGEVKQAGVYVVPKTLSLLDVISVAGGPLPDADLSQIQIINASAESTTPPGKEVIINLEDFFESGKFDVEPILDNGSVIIVQKNKTAMFFDSLPKIINILNIISVSILIYSWLT